MNPLPELEQEYRRHKRMIEEAVAALNDAQLVARPAPERNPVALIVKHLAGNLLSRWTDFLTTDGEKPSRNRDGEFVLTDADTRAALLAAWERGWRALFDTLATLREEDLGRTVTIRGEPHTVLQAVLRGLTHAAYHTGQILYVARLVRPDAPWQTVPPGGSRQARTYFGEPRV